MKRITLDAYIPTQANTEFVTFFLLNARELLSIRLRFMSSKVLSDGFVEQQKWRFGWTKGLLNVLGFYLQHLVIIFH